MTARERRTVVVGAVLAAAILAYWVVSRPAADAPDGAGAEQAALLARYEALVAQRSEVEGALERARQEQERMRAHLFPETNPNLAGAALSRLVEDRARRSGMQLERIQVGTPETVDGALQKISITVHLSGGIHGLGDLLYQLESSNRLLSVETLRVTSVGGPAPPRPGSPAPLTVDMRVVGYTLPPEGGVTTG